MNKQDNILFSQKRCIDTINNLKKFYENNSYICKDDGDEEFICIKAVINECTKKKCPPGYYNLFDKCLYG